MDSVVDPTDHEIDNYSDSVSALTYGQLGQDEWSTQPRALRTAIVQPKPVELRAKYSIRLIR
eukprot:COSAG02_NODE_954_length_15689_cov_14.145927_7_plen_62_part_00